MHKHHSKYSRENNKFKHMSKCLENYKNAKCIQKGKRTNELFFYKRRVYTYKFVQKMLSAYKFVQKEKT